MLFRPHILDCCIHMIIIVTPNQVRNLSRSLLVERLGGLAVSGELNVPALPSLAIVQVPVHVLGEQVVVHVLGEQVDHHSPRSPGSR